MCAAGIAVALANPGRVRHFAKASGVNAKTDAIDAMTLAYFSRAHNPRPYTPPTPAESRLRALLECRAHTIKMRTQETNRLARNPEPFFRRMIEKTIRFLNGQIAELEKELEKLRDEDARLLKNCARLTQIKGVGWLTALNLLGLLPELSELGPKQACALAGLAPWAHDSGARRGARHIRAGRAGVRCALYMAAMSASRHNHLLKRFHARLITKGKKPNVAFTAVMRKLLCLANRLLRDPDFKLQSV